MSSKLTTVDLAVEESDEWNIIIQNARKSVAKVHVSHTRHLDLSEPMAGEGTAFYIDDQNGFMLTNKHIAGPAPFWGFVVFEDNVQLDVLGVPYTDPELDFAILRIDVAQARSHGITAIPIAAEKAEQGLAVCLIGNDSGDGISTGRAIINRTDIKPSYTHDRTAPRNLNTETIQAIFSAEGGGSGSPALSIDGEAVGMLMSVDGEIKRISYLLPLYYPAKALKNLAAGEGVPRGTIQVRWSLQPLHECERYGLPAGWDQKIRAEGRINAIVAEVVLQGGPADGKLKTGDILLKVDGSLCPDLDKLSMYNDEHIGQDVSFSVWRQNREVEVQCRIGDLHAITPGHFINRFDAVFHSIDWRTAAWARVPVGSVYVASAPETGAFKARHLIESIDGSFVENMERLSELLNGLGKGGRHITTVHRQIGDKTQKIETFEYLPTDADQPLEMRRKPREGGDWAIEKSALEPSSLTSSGILGTEIARTVLPKNNHPQTVNKIFQSVVQLRIYRPESMNVDGCGAGKFISTGILLEQGLLITYRGSSTRFDEIRLTIAVGMEVKAKVIFMNEAADFILLEYDAAAVPDGVDLKEARLSEKDCLQEGDGVYFAVFDAIEKRLVHTHVDLLGHRTSDITATGPFVPFHHETILLRSTLSSIHSGVVLYENGAIAGLQQVSRKDAGEHYFLSMSRVKLVLDFWRAGRLSELRFQDFDVSAIPLAKVTTETVVAASGHCSAKAQVLVVDKVPSHCTASNGITEPHPLRKGDVILELNHKRVVQSTDLQYIFTDPSISVLVLRDRKTTEFAVPTIPADRAQVIEFVNFCGALVHRPSLRCRLVNMPCHSEVYIAARAPGSPAHLYDLYPEAFIDLVEGKHITTMDDFKSAISVLDETYFSVQIQYLNQNMMVSLKKNETYWQTFSCKVDTHHTFLI